MRAARNTWRTTEEDMELISSKKRKFCSELENEGYGGGEVELSPENPASPASSRTSCGLYEHEKCSSDVLKKESSVLENVDLQYGRFETEISTSVGRIFSREGSPVSEFYGDSEKVLLKSISPSKKMKPTPPAVSRRDIIQNSPAAAELEEFFAAAEKYNQTRFLEKYNYDIVRDVPLEGKYQWVRLHP